MAAASAGGLSAQGVTTAAIAGTVHAADGTPLDGQVVIENTATGFTVETRARAGRFLVEGLQIGGPYRIRVERLGYTSRERDNVFLTLAEPLRLRFVLQPVAIRVDTIRVVARAQDQARGGTGTTLGDSLLHRLPTMDRDLYDFVSLAPQVATGVGMSAGGVGFRLNNFLIQGVRERSLFGSQPPEFAGGRSIPLSAVSEYQVLISPFDVRYGDFAGAVVNAVTRSGTNRTVGSVFAYTRNDGLAREGGTAGGLPYQRVQLGVTAAGPLRRDRLHYFVASELQQVKARAPGPYVGQPEN
ncbi:MAG: hypothetical protein GWM90_33810, partial [Gemmatimonadetes bacterium]|nr:hypothetical protein [Gemmatimonadota bacterium]NIQ60312.1 hypothetical protein [Gemmatimonadota bacterium]NIU80530.1 hypothetical protein [Gammaproteobacteria bacterium]NIX48852.1 hypothetical protein [Gemmatimonadota bacterium]NIY13305.1 hypothetical protein [Gemmatimonadota bacterium]